MFNFNSIFKEVIKAVTSEGVKAVVKEGAKKGVEYAAYSTGFYASAKIINKARKEK